MTTRYARAGQLAHVEVDGEDRGAVPIERPGFCNCCGSRSRWPLCPECHDVVLGVTTDRNRQEKRT